jgi:hypothetical protein
VISEEVVEKLAEYEISEIPLDILLPINWRNLLASSDCFSF